MSAPLELRAGALIHLLQTDPHSKCEGVAALARAQADGSLALDAAAVFAPAGAIPGRPDKPELVPPRLVGRRSMVTPEGRAMLVHALAHIEFNAINLALDAVWRFPGMPPAYYADWLRVAKEEAYHFSLLDAHLATLGHAYGDFEAHDGLWAMCEKTKDDVVARMALVPRTLEARGLDATPQIQQKLRQVGTPAALRAVDILDVILRDEVGHVAIGNRWYRFLCEREGLDPVAHYAGLVERYAAPRLHPPFNEEARLRAGFSAEELAWLAAG
jgi:uncharacterized ferritin-like protein (DUF455 family)